MESIATLSEVAPEAPLRKRGEHLERGFAHVLDHGGLRRATLRGCEKLTKRQKTGALAYNLSVLLRHLFGVGTLKQALALGKCALLHAFWRLFGWVAAFFAPRSAIAISRTGFVQSRHFITPLHA